MDLLRMIRSASDSPRARFRLPGAMRTLLIVAVILALLVLFMLAAMRYSGFDGFLESIPSNFQWQYLVTGVALLLLSALLRSRLAIVLACAFVLFQFSAFWPYFFGGSRSKEAANICVGVANVNGGNRETGRVGAWVHSGGADVLLLQETNDHWPEYLTRLHKLYPHHQSVRCPDQWGFDGTILSKYPIVEYEEIRVGIRNFPIQRAVIEKDGRQSVFYNLHLVQGGPVRRLQNEELLERVAKEKLPCIVAGDFNSTIWSGSHQVFPGRSGLENAAFGRGYQPTWPARFRSVLATLRAMPFGGWLPLGDAMDDWGELFALFCGIPIDHIYVSRDVGVVNLERGQSINSDHLPLIINLHLLEIAAPQ